MRKVFSTASYLEAQMIRAYLEHSGIEIRLLNENAAGVPGTPHWALPTVAELWVVDESRHSEAVRLLEAYFAKLSGETGTAWLCRVCGQENPASFELCWNCGAARA